MAILVLGGAGYIGSHTVYELIGAGYDTVAADNLQTGFRRAVHPNARFYEADIRDRTAMDKLFSTEKIDCVIHFAACSQVAESMTNPLKYYNNNLCGTVTLLESMTAAGVDKIVFSSTAAVYGEPERVPISEDAAASPTNCYGETKLAMERLMGWVSRAHGLNYIALRYFNACGADKSGAIGEAHDPESHLIPLILQIPNGKRESIAVCGDDYPTRDGTCIRDYIHVSDLASAHILAMEHLLRGCGSETFNLGSGAGFTVNEVIESARRVTGHPIPAVISPRRPGDPAQLVASPEKAASVLGWRPKYTSLDDIISSAWNWHREHPGGFAEL